MSIIDGLVGDTNDLIESLGLILMGLPPDWKCCVYAPKSGTDCGLGLQTPACTPEIKVLCLLLAIFLLVLVVEYIGIIDHWPISVYTRRYSHKYKLLYLYFIFIYVYIYGYSSSCQNYPIFPRTDQSWPYFSMLLTIGRCEGCTVVYILSEKAVTTMHIIAVW